MKNVLRGSINDTVDQSDVGMRSVENFPPATLSPITFCDDILIGGAKNDGIKDIFVFSTGDERDTIRNFQAKGNGHDVIDLDNVISISNFNDLKNNHMSQSGKNVVIDALDGDVIILEGVKIGTLATDDFLF